MRVSLPGLGLCLGLALVSSVVAAGCGDGASEGIDTGDGGGDRSSTSSAPAPSEPSEPSEPSAPLDGRTFVSTSVTEAGQDRPLVDGTRIELDFADGGIRANAGCNSLGGQVSTTPDRIMTGEMASTAMGCDAPLHDQDEWLFGFLDADPSYTLDGHTLRLESGDTVIELADSEVADPDRPLEGTRWALDGMVDGDAASSVPAGGGATLTITGGTASVAVDGCNQGGAEVTVNEGAVVFGGLAMTRMGCAEPAATVEAALVAVLDGEVAYTIDSDTLTLTHPSGQGLTFRAAE